MFDTKSIKNWCDAKSIKTFLFDMDDTLCPTYNVFHNTFLKAFDILSTAETHRSYHEWKNDLTVLDYQAFVEFGVNPIRWGFILDRLHSQFPIQQSTYDKLSNVFNIIYATPLTVFDGVHEFFELLVNNNIKIGIVTHANKDWTYSKYNWLGINKFIDFTDIYIVDENGHKTSQAWKDAISYFKILPINCAVVGDNPKADIESSMLAGVETCFLVEGPKIWDTHQVPVSENVLRIKSLKDIFEIL